jgi:RNA polymerase sigma-70 factor, ECF subfamily
MVSDGVCAMESPWDRFQPAETAAEEPALVLRCQRGDESAFRELMRRHRGRAVYLAAQILRDRTEAEDVVQEAFLRVFRSIHRFRGDASFYSWLHRIVINLCLDRTRLASSRTTFLVDEERDEGSAGGAWETRLQVETLLAQLSDELRITLVMREVGGLSYQEIAAELKVPIGTVRSRLSAAREQFRRLWQKMEAESA